MAAEWELLLRLFEGALERPKDERAAFLDEHTKSDPALRREVETLLAAHEDAGQFLSAPALGPPAGPPDLPLQPDRSASGQARLAAGTSLGAFTVVEPIGAGGMGEVYRARDTRLDRQVAIKVLSAFEPSGPSSLSDDRAVRFEREAKAIAALSHPNIVAVFDTGVQDGRTFVVMELLSGRPLRNAIAGLGLRKAIDVGIQIARGLGAAHEKGIVHRDLKPENVFLLDDGHVKILDFGLARHLDLPTPETSTTAGTDPGIVMGTLGYMAPEQVRGRGVDARTDLFAFGAVLYEMVTGRRAFQRSTPADTVTAILTEEPPDISDARG